MPGDSVTASMRSAAKPAGPRAGFTLLEAAVAVTIVGLAAVSSLAAFGAELRAGERARTALEVEALAEEQLSRLRLVPTALLASLPDSLRRGGFAEPFGRYRWEARVRVLPEEPDLYRASVTISWAEGDREENTLLYRPRGGGR